MAWPTKGSGKSYNSHTGFGQCVGVYTKKVVDSQIYCRLCRVCDVAERTGQEKRKHICIKNWEGSSKSMEPSAILAMVSRAP